MVPDARAPPGSGIEGAATIGHIALPADLS
jgi:hypothetical protein